MIGKLGGCALAARLNGYSPRDSLAVGTLMNTRGLTELVIITVGFTLGLLSDRTFAMMVVMALVTTLMASPIMTRIMPRREMVRLLAGGEPELATCRVLVALGNPDNARALVDAGIKLTGAEVPSELLLVRLVPTSRAPEFRSGLRDEESRVDRSFEAIEQLCNQASAVGVRARAISFLSDDVGQDLAYVADSQHCDLVLLGWYRASLERGVIRALIRRVAIRASCDVVVFLDRQGAGLPHAVAAPVAVRADAQQASGSALEIGKRLAKSLGTTVRQITARNEHDTLPERSEEAVALVIQAQVPSADRDDFGTAAVDCPVFTVLLRQGLDAQ
jgi:hypothetical protein